MASLRKLTGKYARRTTHVGRGRDKEGSSFEIPTDIPVEPRGMSPGDPGYTKAKADLAKLALQYVNDVEDRARGKMTEAEFESRAHHLAKKVAGKNSKLSVPAFVIGWLWEHVIRNRLHFTKTLALCNLVRKFLSLVEKENCKTIHDLDSTPFQMLVFNMRANGYSSGVANAAIIYLRCLGRAIEEATGNDLTSELILELESHDERMPFTLREIRRIFATLRKGCGAWSEEWTIFLILMLYTELRPSDAVLLRRRDVHYLGNIGIVRVPSSKTKNFRGKYTWKPMHRCLQRHLQAWLSSECFQENDFLLRHLSQMNEKALSHRFTKMLKAADIDQERFQGKDRLREFSRKSLYSIKHTSCTWMDAAGASDHEADEHSDKTDQAQEHYRHYGFADIEILRMRWEKINGMPDIDQNEKAG